MPSRTCTPISCRATSTTTARASPRAASCNPTRTGSRSPTMCSTATSPRCGWPSAERKSAAASSSGARGQTSPQLGAGEPPMRDAMLLLGGELGHRPAVTRDDEHRVVAETRVTARRLGDLAAHLAIEQLDVTVRRRERGDADEPSRAIRHTVEHREEFGVPLLGGRVLPEEAAAANAGRPAEREHLETRVVRDRLQPACEGVRARLRRRVLGERRGLLVGLGRDRVEIRRGDELEVDALEDLAVLAELSGVRRTEQQRMAIAGVLGHPSMVAPAVSRCRPRYPSQRGAHQFARPRMRIVAGTTSARMSVASSATATVRPSPTDLMITTSASANATKTPTMIAAAPVMRRPLRSSPLATAAVLSPVRRYSSWMRESSSTS